MNELTGIYTIWLRETKRYFRDRSRIITSLVTPLLWLIIFSSGMSPMSAKTQSIGGSYRSFIFPGIVGMTLLFTSIFVGISVIWDREFGFMKEILVAPISRVSIILGKALGGSTCAMIQGILLLSFGFLIKVHLSIFSFVLCLPVMFLISFGLVTIGLTIASLMDSFEGFNMIMSFVIMPMFFLSGALFPLKNAPIWLRRLSIIDPLTYGVDTLRYVVNGTNVFPVIINILVLICFAILIAFFGSLAFSKRK